jgi:hypothetical protein
LQTVSYNNTMYPSFGGEGQKVHHRCNPSIFMACIYFSVCEHKMFSRTFVFVPPTTFFTYLLILKTSSFLGTPLSMKTILRKFLNNVNGNKWKLITEKQASGLSKAKEVKCVSMYGGSEVTELADQNEFSGKRFNEYFGGWTSPILLGHDNSYHFSVFSHILHLYVTLVLSAWIRYSLLTWASLFHETSCREW